MNKNKTIVNIINAVPFIIIAIMIIVFSSKASWHGYPMLVLFSIAIVIWIQSVRQRIIHADIRRKITIIGWFILIYFLLHFSKYEIAIWQGADLIKKYLWYMYYIPMIALPLLCFRVVTTNGETSPHSLKSRDFRALWIMAVALMLFVLTNDLHECIFDVNPRDISDYSYRWGYYILVVWMVSMMFFSFLVVLINCNLPQIRKRAYIPMMPLVLGILYVTLHNTRLPIFWGKSIKEFIPLSQGYCLMIMLFIESCIQVGYILSNDDYEEIFVKSSIPACFYNNAGGTEYSTDYASLRDKKEGTIIHREKIVGGEFEWIEDISFLEAYRHELIEMREQLENRELLVENAIETKKKQAALEVKNKIYDQIPVILAPEIEKIESLLGEIGDDEERNKEVFYKICIYNAYVKRRSNYMIIEDTNKESSVEELFLAVNEIMENMRIKGVLCKCFCDKYFVTQTHTQVEALENFGKGIEATIDELKAVMVSIFKQEDNIIFRAVMEGGKATPDKAEFALGTRVYREDDMLYIEYIARG